MRTIDLSQKGAMPAPDDVSDATRTRWPRNDNLILENDIMSGITFGTFLSRICACGLLLLVAGALARAEAPPGYLVPVTYGTTIDLAAGIATFAMRFDRTPDFINEANPAIDGDGFQFWTDTVSTDPIRSTYDGILGRGPLGTQMMVTTRTIQTNDKLSYVWPQLQTDPGPKDPGGWGPVKAYADYTLAADNTLSFDVPLTLLRAPDGHFNYVFQTYQFNDGGYINYAGISGETYTTPCVPEPSAALLLAAGLIVPLVARRRRRS